MKAMAENSKSISANTKNVSEQQEKQNHPNPVFSLLQNFLHIFPESKQETKTDVVVSQESTTVTAQEVENGSNSWKPPDVVKFMDARPIVPPPLKLEAEECEQSTSPTVMWQVYALGGFIVLKWIWARWNERRANKESSDEEPSPDDD